ncbi:helix-turn-helix domain-containing protein [Aurantimonas marianensis]|uniref:helix-turn-helix domain-containing protein n=1 Tax=Aurantimonas marianensis TaxID=2920428 RepID=UPI003C2FED06
MARITTSATQRCLARCESIADHLGLTIETVSRTFGRLKEQRLIELVDSRDIRILRRRALLAIGE